MLRRVADFERDLHVGVKASDPVRLVICGRIEANAVKAGFECGAHRQELHAATVRIGLVFGELEPLISLPVEKP